MIKPRIAGAVRTITRARIKIGGALRNIPRGQIQQASTLLEFYSAASSLSLSTNTPLSGQSSSGTITLVAVATPTGGTGPYNYSWSEVSHEGAAPTIAQPTFAGTGLTQNVTTFDEINHCVFQCDVTDSLGATATATLNATFKHISTS